MTKLIKYLLFLPMLRMWKNIKSIALLETYNLSNMIYTAFVKDKNHYKIHIFFQLMTTLYSV